MRKDKKRCHCFDGQYVPGYPGKRVMEMSEEARDIFQEPAGRNEFNKVMSEMTQRSGTPSFHGPNRPSVLPDTKRERQLISPEVLHNMPENSSLPTPVSKEPRYLPNSRIDAAGVRHWTPGLKQFVNHPLDEHGLIADGRYITGNPPASKGSGGTVSSLFIPPRETSSIPELSKWEEPSFGCIPIWVHQTSTVGGFMDYYPPIWPGGRFTLLDQEFRFMAGFVKVPHETGSIIPSWALQAWVWKVDQRMYCEGWGPFKCCYSGELIHGIGPYGTDTVTLQVKPKCDPYTCWPSDPNPIAHKTNEIEIGMRGDDVSAKTGEVMKLEAWTGNVTFDAFHFTWKEHFNDRSLRFVFIYSFGPPNFETRRDTKLFGYWYFTHMHGPPKVLPYVRDGTRGKPDMLN